MGKGVTSSLFWSCLGIILNGVFSSLVGWSEAFEALTKDGAFVARFGFFCTTMAVFLTFYLFGDRLTHKVERMYRGAAPAGFLGVAMLIFAYQQSLITPLFFSVGGCILVGFCYACFFLGCFSNLAETLSGKQTCLVSAAYVSYIFISVLIITTLPHDVQLLIALLLPIAVLLCLLLPRKASVKKNSPATLQGRRKRNRLLQIVLIGFSVVASISYTEAGLWGYFRFGSGADGDWSAVFIACAALLLAIPTAYVSFKACLKRTQSSGYYLPLTIIVIVFVLIIFLEPLDIPIISTRSTMFFLYFVEYFSEATFFFAVLSSCSVLGLSTVRSAGLAYCAFWCISFIWSLLFERIPQFASLFVLIGALLGVLILAHGSSGKLSAPPDRASQCLELARTHGLTERETEILQLLAQGRNVPRIQEELYLAEGTVRNHITHIYRKLGIQTRQEFFDLFQ